jgi:hypothetical protein
MEKETFKEAAEREYPEKRGLISKDILSIIKQEAFINGATWQQKQYTIEEQHIGHTIDELDKEYIKGFNEGSAWQEEKSYTEEEVLDLLCARNIEFNLFEGRNKVEEWFNQFRK